MQEHTPTDLWGCLRGDKLSFFFAVSLICGSIHSFSFLKVSHPLLVISNIDLLHCFTNVAIIKAYYDGQKHSLHEFCGGGGTGDCSFFSAVIKNSLVVERHQRFVSHHT